MKAKLVEKPREEATQEDFLMELAYIEVLALELRLRDIQRRLESKSAELQREKKQNFSRFVDATKKALLYAEKLTDDIFAIDADNKWKNVPIWQEQANELARMDTLYAAISHDMDNVNKVFKLMRELPKEEIVTEEMIDYYRLKKL